MILNALALKLTREAQDDFRERHFEASLMAHAAGKRPPVFQNGAAHDLELRGHAAAAQELRLLRAWAVREQKKLMA